MKRPGEPLWEWRLRAVHSHSGKRPRIGRTSGGWKIDWLGVHVSLRKWI